MKKAGLYIHIPFCKTKCIYCDFYSITERENQIPEFTNAILKEINSYKYYKNEWKFNTLFFGGGTPSLLPVKYLEKIFKKLDDTFDISLLEEISLEANPGEISFEYLKDIRKLGINRLSLGFQSFNDKILKQLGRLHNAKDCFETFDNARKAGFENINSDMIFNIPKLSVKEWIRDLNKLLEINPDHISAYSLTVESGTHLFKMVKKQQILMPSEKIDIEQFLITNELLSENGYNHYEISNYSKFKMECKHNLNYWELSPYLSFGPSSHSYDLKKRWWNVRSLKKYINYLDKESLPVDGYETLSMKDNFNEIIMNGLRLSNGIKLSDLENYNNFIDKNKIDKVIRKWDCLDIVNNNIRIKNNGFLFVDEITKDLFF